MTFLEVQLRGSGFAPEIRQNIIFLPKTVLKKRACAAVRRFALIEIGWKVSQVQRRLGTEKKSTGPACWKSNIILSQQPDKIKTLKIKSRPSSATSLFRHYLAEGKNPSTIYSKHSLGFYLSHLGREALTCAWHFLHVYCWSKTCYLKISKLLKQKVGLMASWCAIGMILIFEKLGNRV